MEAFPNLLADPFPFQHPTPHSLAAAEQSLIHTGHPWTQNQRPSPDDEPQWHQKQEIQTRSYQIEAEWKHVQNCLREAVDFLCPGSAVNVF